MRTSEIKRDTTETKIECKLNIDGTGKINIDTKCGFLNHMLELFTRHGKFDLDLKCDGDIEVDYHHTTEDVGIVIARAFSEALGNRAGILRYGTMIIPMDEALILSSVDISGRGMYTHGLEITREKVGDFDTELVEEFFIAFARELGATIHIKQFAGTNTHHIIEGAFKSFGRALNIATTIDVENPNQIPSTKGTIL